MNAWRGYRRLNAPSRALAREAAVALLSTRVGVRLAGFRRWQDFLAWLTRGSHAFPASRAAEIALARAIAHIATATARHLPIRSNCLERSLALCVLLRRRGISAELRMGARKHAGRFEAHAWVAMDEIVLTEDGGARAEFSPFPGTIGRAEGQAR